MGKFISFVDKCLPFGASISCAIFQDFSDSVAAIFVHRTGQQTVNYLDDYFFAAALRSLLNGQIEEFLQICSLINFPISLEKTVWASQVIIFLGFLIDLRTRMVSIPADKVDRATKLIRSILGKTNKKMTVHQMQKLCGFLNHLCRCIVPGRAFTRRLYAYTGGRLLPHHHIKVNTEIRQDLTVWLKFLENPAIYCRPFIDYTNLWTAQELDWYTDASKNTRLGFGGIFDRDWFYQKWGEDGNEQFIEQADPSIGFLELYAVTVSVVLWLDKVKNTRIKLFCDNDGVVKMINKGSTSKKDCMVLIRIITLKSLECNTRIYAKHVKTDDNKLADALSRMQMTRFDKELKLAGKTINNTKSEIPQELWPIWKIWKGK